MAYSASKYQLTHLLQDAWTRLGQLRVWTATGGSTTTIACTDWAIPEEPVYEDDDPSLIMGTAVVIKDAGGAGAAPEGELGMITDYDSSTSTLTMDTITSAVASGDTFGIVSPLFSLQDMIVLTNIALRKLGVIDLIDTSISIASGQSEYTLPTTIRTKPVRVRKQTNQGASDNQWELVTNWSIIPATAGSNWTLVLPPLEPNYSIEILYRSLHPKVSSYDSDIAEIIHPELALNALIAEAYQWYNNQVGGSNQYFLQRENKAIQDLEAAKVLHPIYHAVEQIHGMPHWGTRSEYVPLTSDLKA